jgi:hypothetical protein
MPETVVGDGSRCGREPNLLSCLGRAARLDPTEGSIWKAAVSLEAPQSLQARRSGKAGAEAVSRAEGGHNQEPDADQPRGIPGDASGQSTANQLTAPLCHYGHSSYPPRQRCGTLARSRRNRTARHRTCR